MITVDDILDWESEHEEDFILDGANDLTEQQNAELLDLFNLSVGIKYNTPTFGCLDDLLNHPWKDVEELKELMLETVVDYLNSIDYSLKNK